MHRNRARVKQYLHGAKCRADDQGKSTLACRMGFTKQDCNAQQREKIIFFLAFYHSIV